MNSGIYIIENTRNGKVYVGSAQNFVRRLNRHRSLLRSGAHPNSHLQQAWDKYGSANFEFTKVLYCDREVLIQWEQIAIDGFRNTIGWEQMYNKTPTAGSQLGAKFSD